MSRFTKRHVLAMSLLLVVGAAGACRRAPAPRETAASPSASTAVAAASPSSPPSTPPDPCRVTGGRGPLLVRWSAAERAELVSAMRSGIAIVAADDCRGVRLLPHCTATGRYGYLGSAPADREVDLRTEEEVRINAPAGASAFGSDAGVAALHVVTHVVGRRTTPRALLDPAELSGSDCAGATHFVVSVGVGAVGSGASAACTGARPGATASTLGCDTLVDARLDPIAPLGSLVGFDKAPADAVLQIGTCPPGMVVTGERCARPPVTTPYLCSFGDTNECQTQCDRGDINSCDVLAFMLRAGKSVTRDEAKALGLYDAMCTRGDAIACANAGEMVAAGQGGPKNPARGVTLVERACTLGEPTACAQLAVLRQSTGIDPSEEHLRTDLQRLWTSGGAESGLELAIRLLEGTSGSSDPTRAKAILTELCGVNHARGCGALARATYLGKLGAPDPKASAPFFVRACRAADDDSCVMLGLMYRQADGVARDDVLATQLMDRACQDGSMEGCHNLGIAFERGKGVPADVKHAAELYDRACTGGIAKACAFLADFAADGTAVPKDPARATSLRARACSLGDQESCGGR